MYRNAVEYKGVWLAPGSESYRLFHEKKFKELDQHQKLLAENERKLIEGK